MTAPLVPVPMPAVEIIPSILSADFARLADAIDAVRAAGIRTVQVDVMDGVFVPNISVGLPVVAALKALGGIRLDVHLMIIQPERYVQAFIDAGADVLTVHSEATSHLHRALETIRAAGVKAGAALNPATPTAHIEGVLELVDVALVMTVNPGFGGQRFIRLCLPKVERLSALARERGLGTVVQVDGGINALTIGLAVAAGARQCVAGSAVYGAGVPVAEAVARLNAAAAAALPKDRGSSPG
ncbi:MAG: ribulose-phosphate 3-epimerase [Ardenticatenales bacterium]